jgi:hypothetical protein
MRGEAAPAPLSAAPRVRGDGACAPRAVGRKGSGTSEPTGTGGGAAGAGAGAGVGAREACSAGGGDALRDVAPPSAETT